MQPFPMSEWGMGINMSQERKGGVLVQECVGGRYAKEVGGVLCVQEVLQDNGDQWLIGVAQIKTVATKGVVMFEGNDAYTWMDGLSFIGRIEPDIQFVRTAFKLID